MSNFIPVSMALIWMNEWMCHRFAKNADFEEVDLTLTDPRESRKKWNFKKANEQMSIELHLKIVFLEGVKNIADFAKEVTKHYINMPLFQKAILYYVYTFLSVIGLGAGNKRRTWNKRRAWKIWKKKNNRRTRKFWQKEYLMWGKKSYLGITKLKKNFTINKICKL